MNPDYEKVGKILNYVFKNAIEGDADSVVKAIDEYTATIFARHIGAAKGAAVDLVIQEHKPKILVELGGYFGYSAIRFANEARNVNPDARYYSVEYNPVLACLIRAMATYAGLGNVITVLVGNLTMTIGELKQKISPDDKIGFFFLDHLKVDYVPDLELVRKEGLLEKGSAIVADNIISPGAPEYKKYMEEGTELYTSTYQELGQDAIIVSSVN